MLCMCKACMNGQRCEQLGPVYESHSVLESKLRALPERERKAYLEGEFKPVIAHSHSEPVHVSCEPPDFDYSNIKPRWDDKC